MNRKSIPEIGRAISECVRRSTGTPNPLDSLAESLQDLRDSGEWSAEDFRTVETAARKVLKELLDLEGKPPDAHA